MLAQPLTVTQIAQAFASALIAYETAFASTAQLTSVGRDCLATSRIFTLLSQLITVGRVVQLLSGSFIACLIALRSIALASLAAIISEETVSQDSPIAVLTHLATLAWTA